MPTSWRGSCAVTSAGMQVCRSLRRGLKRSAMPKDDREPLCDIAKLCGIVPLACLFKCQSGICEGVKNMRMPDVFDREVDDDEPRTARCNRCGSTDVRWRQQTGKWVLFSLTPGKEHVCDLSEDDFPEVTE